MEFEMDQNVEMLVALMNGMKDVYTQMIKLSGQKRDCIISGDMESVGEIARMEWAMLDNIAPLEEGRQELIEQICEEWGLSGGWTIMAEVEKRTGGDEYEEIKRADDELKKTIAVQREIHDHNMALLDAYFEHMDFITKNFEDIDAKKQFAELKIKSKRVAGSLRDGIKTGNYIFILVNGKKFGVKLEI